MIAGAFLIVFLIRELMAEHPVVNLRIFKVRSYSTGVFLMAVLGFVMYGSIVILPIWLQTLMGYPATRAGMTMAPRGLGIDGRDAAGRASSCRISTRASYWRAGC